MNRAIQLKTEIQKLEAQLEQLNEELIIFQLKCDHEFEQSHYTRKCTKCQLIESLNW
ncbi:hypothetical protein J2S09_003110 [Bacillus fengqiuensis]|nr:hypothetical protein [Bacillus fengqiuensis]